MGWTWRLAHHRRNRTKVEKKRLTGRVLCAVIVIDDEELAVCGNRDALHLFDCHTVKGIQHRHKISHQDLRHHWNFTAGNGAETRDIDRIDTLLARVISTNALVTLDDRKSVVVDACNPACGPACGPAYDPAYGPAGGSGS